VKLIRKNKKENDCGIVAAYNVASWCNIYKSYSEVERIAKSCGYNSERGIFFFQFAHLMKKLNIPIKKVNVSSIEDMKEKFYAGKLLAFLYTSVGFNVGHAMIGFLGHNAKIQMVNSLSSYNWIDFSEEIEECGMKNFIVYEIPARIKK